MGAKDRRRERKNIASIEGYRGSDNEERRMFGERKGNIESADEGEYARKIDCLQFPRFLRSQLFRASLPTV